MERAERDEEVQVLPAELAGQSLESYVASCTEEMTAQNYGELDAMVFARLVYAPLERADPPVRDGECVAAVCAQLLAAGQGDRDFLQALQESPRYGRCTLCRCVAVPDDDPGVQWAAVTVRMSGSEGAVLAFRGSTQTNTSWREDFELGDPLIPATGAQELSREYLEGTADEPLFLTGHSKGGNDAISGFVMAAAEVRARVVRIDNFDGPGNNAAFRERYREGYAELGEKLHSFFPEDSVVGQLLGGHPGEKVFVESEESFWVSEHFLRSWRVAADGSGLARGVQSAFSRESAQKVETLALQLSAQEQSDLMGAFLAMGIHELVPALSSEDRIEQARALVSVVLRVRGAAGQLLMDVELPFLGRFNLLTLPWDSLPFVRTQVLTAGQREALRKMFRVMSIGWIERLLLQGVQILRQAGQGWAQKTRREETEPAQENTAGEQRKESDS